LALPPDVVKAIVTELLHPIDTRGERRFVYSYRRENGSDEVREFLERLEKTEKGRYTRYMTAFRFFGMGRTRGDVWHMLDQDKAPKGVTGDTQGIGEFKNIGHKSRILHCNDESLCILLTKFEGKKEDELPAEAVNPALAARDDYFRRRDQLIARLRRSQK
jgi:hypothetical protein